MMTLEESPDQDDEQRTEQDCHRFDLWADVTIYAMHHDPLDTRTSIRTMFITL
jgi:hypothetical protein